MLKHMLTPNPHPRPPAPESGLATRHLNGHVSSAMEELSMLEESGNGVLRSSHLHGGSLFQHNQSVYANTSTLPKMSGTILATRAGQHNGLNHSKISSSNSPGTTNQTKTSLMESTSSRDQSQHDLESTKLSPIGRSRLSRVAAGSAAHRTHVDVNNDGTMCSSSYLSHRSGVNMTLNGRRLMNASLPANVTKLMNLSREAGVNGMLTSLGLLCLVSLLLALLSLVFLLKISPSDVDQRHKKYQLEVLSAEEYVLLYEVTLALCAISLCLNLCCLLVCSIQFLFSVKLLKSSHGKIRTGKYLREASWSRVSAIAGFFVSIPVFLAGIVLYTFLHFDSTPAIVTSVIVGLGIFFCGGAVVHNVFIWQKEKIASIRGDPGVMSPVLARIAKSEMDNTKGAKGASSGTNQTLAEVMPTAKLDLSNPNNASSNNSRALELSTLV